jgi:hypothetical protein
MPARSVIPKAIRTECISIAITPSFIYCLICCFLRELCSKTATLHIKY